MLQSVGNGKMIHVYFFIFLFFYFFLLNTTVPSDAAQRGRWHIGWKWGRGKSNSSDQRYVIK